MNPDWADEAACRGMDRETFFPKDPRGRAVPALRVCVDCPVRWECLDFAMRVEYPHKRYGIYGGTVPHQRARIADGEWVTLDKVCQQCQRRFIPVFERAIFCGQKCQGRYAAAILSREAAAAGMTVKEWQSARQNVSQTVLQVTPKVG